MAKRWLIGLGCVASVAITGCATQPPPVVKDVHRDWLLQQIDHSASQVADAQTALARMAAAQHPAMIPVGPPVGAKLPPELSRHIYLHWQGSVADAVQSMAHLINYRVQSVGIPDPNPVIVNIETDSESVFDVLQAIGLQCGNRAGVLVNPVQRKIMLVWTHKTTGIKGYNVSKSW